MRKVILFFIFLLSFSCIRVWAQKTVGAKEPRILILLDESSSMLDDWTPGKPRYNAARDIIVNLIDSIYDVNPDVEFSLRVFGHQHIMQEKDCYDTRNEVMFSKNNLTQMTLRLESIQPLGVTPIAYSLRQAAENDLISENKYAYSIVLITDGGESCGGDICDVVKTLINKKIFFKPYIISLVDYAPLRTQYACLGEYLQVTKQKDIPQTIGTIVEAYRPMLRMEVPVSKPLQTPKTTPVITTIDVPKVNIPEPPKDTTPVVKPKPAPVIKVEPILATTVKLSNASLRLVKINYPTIAVRTRLVPPTPPIKLDVPEPATTSRLVQRKMLLQKTNYPSVVVRTRPVPPMPPIKIEQPEPEVPVRLPQTTAILVPKPVKRYRLLYLEAYIETRKVPPPGIKIFEEEKVVTTPAAPPRPPATPPRPSVTSTPIPEKIAPTTVTSESADETTVSVYFTDGRGKYYQTTPQVLLTDATTGQQVKKFYRTIDANGNPDAQTDIPAGNYVVTVIGRSGSLKGNRVTIKEKNKNRIDIVVTSGSLHFQYKGAPDKPIVEFNAVVVQRQVAQGKVIKQKCTAQLEYEPGNYFVEINTLPITRRNVDVDFGSTTILEIDQPGYVQFTNTEVIKDIRIFQTLGDAFAPFYTMDITGNLEEQKLRLQPGAYQARFKKSKMPYAEETIMPFKVKSNAITEMELK